MPQPQKKHSIRHWLALAVAVGLVARLLKRRRRATA
jgi:hypothetical protein